MKQYISKEVDRLIKLYNTRNPYEIAEAQGIEVLYHSLGEDMEGFICSCEEGLAIVINSNISKVQEPVVLGHEIGHGYLHNSKADFIRGKNRFSKEKVLEYEANLFALELLGDEGFFRNFEGRTFKEMAEVTGLPEEMLERKYEEVLKAYKKIRKANEEALA